MSLLNEFKSFASKGNALGLAIGVIIGNSFSELINSIVTDIFMPVIGWITGGIDFSNFFIQLSGDKKQTLKAAKDAGATIAYGQFITILINFLIIAFLLFIVFRVMKRLALAPQNKLTKQEDLLTQIRDLLAQNSNQNTDADKLTPTEISYANPSSLNTSILSGQTKISIKPKSQTTPTKTTSTKTTRSSKPTNKRR